MNSRIVCISKYFPAFVLLLLSPFVPSDELSADEASILLTEKKLYSQGNEELIIRDFFKDMREGFFLDVGCGHHQRNSTTYYLEKHLGWQGIGVDALKFYEDEYAEYRPNTAFEHYIVTDHSGTYETFYISKSSADVSSVHQELVLQHGPESIPVKVRTITLNELLEKRGVKRIDFLSMDIEDSEPAALAGFNIQKYKPSLVGIEAHETVADSLRVYFEENGYERIDRYLEHDQLNWYYRPKEA